MATPTPSSTSPARTAGKRKAAIAGASSIAVPVLLTLLAANLAALVVLAWRFLPDHDGGGGVGVGGTTPAGAGARARGRSDGGPDGPTVEALRRTLFRDPIVRYDVVPAALHRTPGARGVVHQLPSIPDRRRMLPNAGGEGGFGFVVPPDATRNLTYFLEARLREDEEDRPLFLYNPSVLPLDGSRIGDAILRDLGVRPDDFDGAGPPGAPRYVATFRVSNFGNCHGPGRGVPDTYRNYLGLALLDARLDVARDPEGGAYLDVVIDLNQRLWEINWSPGGGRGRPREPKQYMQDCQLFAAASPSEGGGTGGDGRADRLILLCNEYVVPVRLRARGGGDGPDDAAVGNRDDGGEAIRFENTYGSGLQLTALRKPIVILRGGKNLHYIPPAAGVVDGGGGGGHLEIWPGGPHEVLPVDFSRYPFVERGGGGGGRGPLETSKSSRAEPEPSFPTMDYGLERKAFIDRDSGSACCVSVLWKDDDDRRGGDGGRPGGRRLLLGFSHRKTRRQPRAGMYNYVSRVYAFEPSPPFDVVARSGYFCLGFATDDEALRTDNEQVRGAAGEYRLKVREEEFDCPRIHFVTGIAEKPGDEGTVIVSYGVNDCYPRMAEVSKDFLVALLKGQHR